MLFRYTFITLFLNTILIIIILIDTLTKKKRTDFFCVWPKWYPPLLKSFKVLRVDENNLERFY